MNSDRDCSFDYLRAAITVLVVVHHAALAYTTFSVYRSPNYTASTAPVVDTFRAPILDYVVGFNDGFFMALMFFIAGLFIWPSLQRKGGFSFLKDRARRLLLPYFVAVGVLVPLAYYPSYLGTDRPKNVGSFLRDFYSLDGWPAGPSWFIWALFAFSALVVALAPFFAARFQPTIPAQQKPEQLFRVIAGWVVGTAALCWLMSFAVAPFTWWRPVGPLWIQAARVPLYFAYFTLGVSLGRRGITAPWLRREELLFRAWPAWLICAVVSYLAFVLASPALTGSGAASLGPRLKSAFYWLLFASSCAFACLALTGFFRTRVTKRSRAWDSLSANAYLIYLLHYVVVIWLQYLLLSWPGPALLKFAAVLVGALGLSWLAAAGLRRLPVIAALG